MVVFKALFLCGFEGEDELADVGFYDLLFDNEFFGGAVDVFAAVGVTVEVECIDMDAVLTGGAEGDAEGFEGVVLVGGHRCGSCGLGW